MNARNLIDQLLSSGQQAFQQVSLSDSLKGASDKAGFGGGALAGGALGLLLGNKRLRKMGGGVLAYGSVAALGALAYKVYNDYQQEKPQDTSTPVTVDRLDGPTAEQHAQAMLKALIAAAKSDGHVDARERALLEEQLGALADDATLRRWIDEELKKPLDPADVAQAATSQELAAEMYLVSVMAVDEESFMERAYLDELARRLSLPPELKAKLEAQKQSVPQ